ncbi:hypothetical protein QIS99_31255 [Streptomyces sp. B-S-A8]|uniref:DUF4253 domain-containing protein n=1 Tax=Streptomyces solicavernae TaxID=3043614 RepID=A0ABT6S1U0_9ACTN|nr:hypothetical protein [Streptomyces sp. B-S-A8]MDI3390640.1 hypothetical protein [Streptomyces sp. B-S-A8]
MSDPTAVIDAEAFPLHVVGGPHLMVMVPVAGDAVEGLDEAYTEASLDVTEFQTTGTTIDARWAVPSDRQQVLLHLKGRAPRRFDLTVRFELKTPRQRQGFLDMAAFDDRGRVSLWIYPDQEDTARAAVAMQKGDMELFVCLGISVEEDIPCRALRRLAQTPGTAV